MILSISYTAEYDVTLREQVQQASGALERSLLSLLRSTPLSRLLSLKHDLAASFNRVLHSAPGTAVPFELGDNQLPFFLVGRSLVVERAILGVELAPGADPTGLSLSLDGRPLRPADLEVLPELAGMHGWVLPATFGASLRGPHTLAVQSGGALQPTAPLPGDPSPLDDERLRDLVLLVTLRLGP